MRFPRLPLYYHILNNRELDRRQSWLELLLVDYNVMLSLDIQKSYLHLPLTPFHPLHPTHPICLALTGRLTSHPLRHLGPWKREMQTPDLFR